MRRVPELDGLRALAVASVVLFHASSDHRFGGGFVGVDMFFVLSAFLITGVLSERPTLATFYWRRFTRLTPALFFMLVGYLALAPFVWPGYPHARDASLAALYLSDYSFTFWRMPLYLQHSWSLAAEEQFYLIWPAIMAMLSRSRVPLVWLGTAWVGIALWRFSFTIQSDYYYRLDTHSTGLILGAMLCFALPRLSLRPFHAYCGAALFAVAVALGQFEQARGVIPMAEIGSAMLIGCAATGSLGRLGPVLRNPVSVTLGRWSYGIYLWHYPIAVAVRDQFDFAESAVITLSLSTALAYISYLTVERWGRQLRDRRFWLTTTAKL